MASYLVRRGNSEDGALKVIQESIDDLENQFKPWQRRVEGWDRAVFPETQGHVARDLGSYFMQGLKPEALQRSKYVTAWCRSSLEALVNRLMRAEKSVLPKMISEDEAEAARMERFIMFALGVFSHLDEYEAATWRGLSFDYRLKSNIMFFGKAVTAVQVVKGASGSAQVRARLLDPYSCFHDLGGETRRFVYKRLMTVRDLPAFLDTVGGAYDVGKIAKEVKEVPVYAFWLEEPGANGKRDVYESILIQGTDSKSAILPGIVRRSRFPQIPISIVYRSAPGGIAGMAGPAEQKQLADSEMARHAEPFYAPAIPILEQLNEMLGLDMDNTALSVLPPITVRSPDGGRPVEKTEIGPGELIYLDPQTLLEALKIGGAQLAQSQSFARLLEELEGLVPTNLRHPESNPGDSGYKVNSELDMSENVMVPWTRLVNRADTDIIRHVIQQHMETGYVFELPGKRSVVNGVMADYFIRWTKEDYPVGSLAVDVEEPTELPKDWHKSFLIYQLAVSSGAMDPVTARYRILKLFNSPAIQRRVDAYALSQTPFMLQDRLLADLSARAQALEDEAERARKENQRPETVMAKEIAAGAAWIRVQRAQQSALMEPGASTGQPALPPPEQMPPEESMAASPDEQAAAEGRPNAERRGRPRARGTR